MPSQRRALMDIPCWRRPPQQEVGHESDIQDETGCLTQGPEVREAQACVEVLLERAHAKRSKRAGHVLGKMLGGSQL